MATQERGAQVKPDWELTEAQMFLYGCESGMSGRDAEREARRAVRDMKAEYRATGKLPKGW